MASQERRQAPRIAEQIPVAIQDAGEEFRTETQNISTAGAYCTLNRFIAPMTKLQLQCELPDGARRVRIRCSGVVVRIEPSVPSPERALYNIAIFFTELAERDRIAISRFIRRRLTQQKVPTR